MGKFEDIKGMVCPDCNGYAEFYHSNFTYYCSECGYKLEV